MGAPTTASPTIFEPKVPTPFVFIPDEGCEGPPPVPAAECIREEWTIIDLVETENSTVISEGSTLQVSGCAQLAGTLVFNASQVDLSGGQTDVVVVNSQSNCLNGTFGNVIITGRDDTECIQAQQTTSTSSLSVQLVDTCRDKLSTGALVGIIVGGFIGVGILAALVLIWVRKRAAKGSTKSQDAPDA